MGGFSLKKYRKFWATSKKKDKTSKVGKVGVYRQPAIVDTQDLSLWPLIVPQKHLGFKYFLVHFPSFPGLKFLKSVVLVLYLNLEKVILSELNFKKFILFIQ